MTKIKVAKTGDIASGGMIGVEAQGKMILIAKTKDGIYAMDGICSHMGGRLWEGKLDGIRVKCPRHGSEFDVTTGRNVKKPWLPFGKAADLRSYPVTVEGEDVYLEI